MDTSKKHILVTGSHRSGTTWVGTTIAQHRRVTYIREPFHVESPNKEMGLKLNTWFTHYESSDQKEEIKSAFDCLLQSNPLDRTLHHCRKTGLDMKIPLRFIKHLALNSISPQRFLIKDPIALLSAGWLHETYDLKVICMIRSPLAFVGSLKKAGWDCGYRDIQQQEELMDKVLMPLADDVNKMCESTGDFIDRACLLWNILHFAIITYEKKYPSWLFVKYEDIAENPASGFEEIFDYLELDMSRDVREYIEKYTSEKNPAESTGTIYQPRNSKMSLNTWKQRLSSDEAERVRTATKKIASQLYAA